MHSMASFRLILLTIMGLFLAACSAGKTSPTPRLYLLHPMATPSSSPSTDKTKSSPTIIIAPVQLPEYLVRPQIVTKVSPSEVVLAEYDRWAEPLRDQLSQITVENLTRLLPGYLVYDTSWRSVIQVDYRLMIKIIQMAGKLGEVVSLEARWALIKQSNDEPVLIKRTHLNETMQSAEYQELVNAYSQIILKLNAEMAAEIRDHGHP